MSLTVDNRVVQMIFDNKDFEKNVKKTLSSLGDLNNGVNGLGTSVQSSGLGDSLTTLTKRFSTAGIVGMSVIQNLTNGVVNLTKQTISSLIQGGKQRALNIEQAKFQFKGLGMDVEATMANANEAVKGTAYGLDEAAKVASMLGASGMRAGDQMTSSLRAVAGVAAMTGSAYSDIGNIFTTVAGNGRLMGEQLLQLSGRGINAAATLGKYLGKTEAEVRDMVSKGQIDFKTFSNAMDSAFGEHAKDANKTFVGALSNMKAALSRIGAEIFIPLHNNMRDVFNALSPTIDAIHKAIMPLIEVSIKGMEAVSKFIVKFLGGIDFTGFSKGIEAIAEKFKMTGQTGENLKNTLKGLGVIVKFVWSALKLLINIAGDIIMFLSPIGTLFLTISGNLGRLLESVDKTKTKSEKLIKSANGLSNGFNAVAKAVHKVSSALETVLVAVFDKVLAAVAAMRTVLTPERLRGAFNISAFVALIASFGKVFSDLVSPFKTLGDFLNEGKDIVSAFKGVLKQVGDTISAFTTSIKSQTLLKIAEALAILAVSLWLISSIETKKLIPALIAIDVLGVVLTKTFSSLSVSMKTFDVRNAVKLGVTVNLIATAIFILAGAMKMLSSMDWDGVAKGIIGMSSLALMIYILTENLSDRKTKTLTKGLGGLILIAAAVKIMVGAMVDLGSLNWDGLAKGLIGVSVILLAIFQFVKALGNEASITLSVAASLIIIAKAVDILASAVSSLAALDLQGLVKGLVGLGIVLAEISIFIGSLDKITGGLEILAISAGLFILSKALLGFAECISVLGKLSLNSLIKGVGALGFTLATVAVAMMIMEGAIGGAAALILAAIAIRLLSVSLLALAAVKPESISKALSSLIKTLSLIAVASLILTPLSPLLLITAAALTVFGSAMVLIGKGMVFLASGIAALGISATTGATGIATAIRVIIESFIDMIGSIAKSIADGFVMFTETIAANMPKLVTYLGQIIAGLLDLINDNVPKIIDTLLNVLVKFLESIGKALPAFIDAGAKIVIAFIEGLGRNMPKITDAGFKMVIDFINGVADAVRNNAPALRDAAINLVDAFVDAALELLGINSPSTVFADIGLNTILGFVQGIVENIGLAVQAIKDFIVQCLENTTVGSWVLKGYEAICNFIDGIKSGDIFSAIKTKIEDALTAAKEKYEDFKQMGKDFIDKIIEGLEDNRQALVTWLSKIFGHNNETDNGPSASGKTYGQQYVNGIASVDASGAGASLASSGKSGAESVNYGYGGIYAGSGFSNALAGFSAYTSGQTLATTGQSGANSISYLGSGVTAGSGFSNALAGVNAYGSGRMLSTSGNSGASSVSFYGAGSNAGAGFTKGISAASVVSRAVAAARSLGSSALKAIQKVLGIHSPSTKFIEVAKYSILGLVKGFKKYSVISKKSAEDLGKDTLIAVTNPLSKISGVMDSLDGSPTITPVIDLSDVESGISAIDNLINVSRTVGISSNVNNRNSKLEDMQNAIFAGVQKALDINAKSSEDATYTFVTNVDLDGKTIAKGTAVYTQEELNKMQVRNNRKLGII